MSSILNDTKKILGIAADYTAFDTDIIIHINTVLAVLDQIGVGLPGGFEISDDTAEWTDFLDNDPRLNTIKSYVYLRVRMLFDPPTTSFHLESLEKQIRELGWRMSVQRESVSWVDPEPEIPEDLILDGGAP